MGRTLTALGFAPQRERPRHGRVVFRLGNCPYRDAVRENQPVVCALHRGLTRGLLDQLDPAARLTDFVPKDPDRAGCLIEVEGLRAGVNDASAEAMTYFCEAICEKLSVMGQRAAASPEPIVRSWDLRAVELRPHSPEILSSSDEARAVVLEIPAGESLQDHQVHERAWVSVIDGEVEITTTAGENVAGGSGPDGRVRAG